MKNLKEFNLQELTQSELLEIEGGSIFSKVGNAVSNVATKVADWVVEHWNGKNGFYI